MSDASGYFASGFIACVFLSGISYYVLLYKFMRKIKSGYPAVWASARQASVERATDFLVAYRILSNTRGNPGESHFDRATLGLAKATKINLYVSMSSFMVLLFVGLYVSVNK
jgi:hypothetical protein